MGAIVIVGEVVDGTAFDGDIDGILVGLGVAIDGDAVISEALHPIPP